MTQQEAEVTLKVNSKEAQEKLEKLEAKAADLRQKFADAFRKGDTRAIDSINKELQRTNKEINNMRTNAANIRAAMQRLDQASPRDLQRTIKLINNELNSGRVRRGSKEWDEYIARLKQAQAELQKVKAEMSIEREHQGFFSRGKNMFNDWGASLAAAAAAFAGVTMAGKAAVKAYADMEAEEANVRKFTGMTAKQVALLNDEFKKMDTRTSREDLNKLAQEAGRLGKQSQEAVLGFVKAADQLNVALDDLGEGATLTLSKLTGIFGDEARYGTEQSLLKVGSVINELSQNCSASAPYLAEFSSRLGGIAAQSKMTISQVMAFAAVLDTQNLAVEASSTAVGQLITKIYQEPQKIAQSAGLDVKKFSDMVKTDMNGALIMLFEHLNKFGGMETLAKVFDGMGTDGARAIPVLAALSGHVEELKNQQQAANDAFREGTSVTNEFNVQNNTVQAGLDKAKKGFNEMAVQLGQQLLPVMRYCISGTSMLMRVMSGLVSFFLEHKKAILTLSSAIIAYNVIVGLYAAKAKIAATWTALWTAATTKFQGVAAVFKLLLAGLTNVVQYFTNGLQVNYTMQDRWRKAMAGMTFGGWIGLVMSAAAAVYLLVTRETEAEKKTREFKQSINKAVAGIAKFDEETKKEKENLDKLFGALDAATEGTNDYEKAKQAIIDTYGDYLSDLVDEHGRITNLATAYDRLAESIRLANLERGIKNAKDSVDNQFADRMNTLTEGLQQTLLDYGVSIREATALTTKVSTAINLGVKLDQATISRINVITAGATGGRQSNNGQSGRWEKLKANWNAMWGDYLPQPAEIVNQMFDASEMKKEALHQVDLIARTEHPLRDLQDNILDSAISYAEEAVENSGGTVLRILDAINGTFEMVEVDAAEARRLLEEFKAEKNYRTGGIEKPEVTVTPTTTPTIPPSEDESKKRLSEAKEALKKALDERKSQYLQAEAENLTLYVTGQRNYEDYLAKCEELDREYADDVIKIHENHNKLDIAGYGQALKKKAELQRKQQEAERKKSLQELDDDHTATTGALTSAYWDANSPDFQNKKLLTQALLDEDLRYLKEKQKLYAEKSPEWEDLQRQINERVAQDQLDKQKETAEAYMRFQQQYGQASESMREQMEIAILDNLKNEGLISEEQYQKAVADIKKKYRDEDVAKARKVQSEYADMVVNLYDSFSKLFSEMGKEGTDFWSNLSDAATASLAVISTMLSQYSSYVSAERDLELAKVEKRYDKEIAAAGKNEKKKKKLEEQKEKEVAAIKKKYNEKAMKIELAQAIAQTAQAAIAAYASAAAIPATGWIMAPIAAALATAAGMMQVAVIKKQHEAEAAGYYEGGFTPRDANKRKEVGVVHANEFVANHEAVANPALAPVLRLIDSAQRNNTVGSLTAADVSNALGQGRGVSARGEASGAGATEAIVGATVLMADENARTREAVDRLSDILGDGLQAFVIMDGERGLYKSLKHFEKLSNNPKR